MKTLICYRCKKTVEVEDVWTLKACPLCKTKEKARKQVQKEKRRLDREARNKIKELKLEKALRFGEWEKLAKEKFNNPNPTWEQYLGYLKQRKEHEIFDKAEREIFHLKASNQKKYALMCSELFPLSHGKECSNFRLSRLNGSKNLEHLDGCSNCSDWNYNFINDLLPTQDEDVPEPVDKIEQWEIEQSRRRGGTIPNPEIEKYNSTEKPERQQEKPVQQQQEPDIHSEPEQPDPTSTKNDLTNILSEYDRKRKESIETDNQ